MTDVTQTSQYVAIENARVPYITDLTLSYVNTTTFSISDGRCSNSDNSLDIEIDTDNVGTTVNFSVVGLNGLDTGTIAASTVYYVYAIADVTETYPAGFVVSVNKTTPYLPTGYGIYRMIGTIVKTAGSVINSFYEIGKSNTRVFRFVNPITILSGGSSGTAADILLTTFVPAFNLQSVQLVAAITPSAASETFKVYPGQTTGANGLVVYGQVAAVINTGYMDVQYTLDGSNRPVIGYVVSGSATGSLYLQSYTMYF